MRFLFVLLLINFSLLASQYSPLVEAIIDKNSKKAIELIEKGVSLKEYSNEDSIKKIITPNVHTSYVGGRDEEIFPIVVLVASIGDVELLKKIKQKDKKALYLKDIYGNDALMWASREGHEKAVRFLLDNGFDPLYKASNTTAFELSMKKVKYKVINHIIEHLIQTQETDILSYTIWSMAREEEDIVERLIQYGIKDTYKGYSPRTTLTKVAEVGNIKRFDFLVKNGSDPYESNTKVRIGFNPLISAIESHQSKMVKYLLEKYNYDLNIIYKNENLLHVIYSYNDWFDKEIFEFLLNKSNLDINSKNSRGETLLEVAIYNNDKKAVEYFLYKKLMKN